MDEERKLYANPVNLVSYLIPLQVFFQKLRFISLYLCVLNVYVIYIYIYILYLYVRLNVPRTNHDSALQRPC